MPVHFIDNYPKNDLESQICRQDKSPLYGEIWIYQEFLKFNENNFLKDENWYVKHNYNLSSHPSSEGKVEGQIDYLIVSKYGTLIIEVKGGGIEVDHDDVYYSYDKKDKSKRYEAQNPFSQVKEYVHSLKSLIDSNPFIYRAVVFPHESNFILKGPQLSGYQYLFFSKKDLEQKESEFGKNELFYNFLIQLAKDARKNIIKQLNPSINKDKLETRVWEQFPQLNKRDIDRLRSEFFPVQTTYGFDPNRIKNEIILEENYEILKGLRKNRKVMVQGAPGTGKTVLAMKFLAENLIKQHKGVFFCANRLLRSKMEYIIYNEYKLDPNLITFRIYYPDIKVEELESDIDFVIIDEAQEFFDKGLYDFINEVDVKMKSPKFLILYDPEQAIVQNYKDIDWYADFLLETTFVHYLFDTTWRCTQNKDISDVMQLLKNSQYKKILKDFSKLFLIVNNELEKLKAVKDIIDSANREYGKYLVLVDSHIIDDFRRTANDYFRSDIEELTPENINVKNQKIRFTTPIMYRGLEAENIIFVTSTLNDNTKIQSFIGISRAMYSFKCVLWN